MTMVMMVLLSLLVIMQSTLHVASLDYEVLCLPDGPCHSVSVGFMSQVDTQLRDTYWATYSAESVTSVVNSYAVKCFGDYFPDFEPFRLVLPPKDLLESFCSNDGNNTDDINKNKIFPPNITLPKFDGDMTVPHGLFVSDMYNCTYQEIRSFIAHLSQKSGIYVMGVILSNNAVNVSRVTTDTSSYSPSPSDTAATGTNSPSPSLTPYQRMQTVLLPKKSMNEIESIINRKRKTDRNASPYFGNSSSRDWNLMLAMTYDFDGDLNITINDFRGASRPSGFNDYQPDTSFEDDTSNKGFTFIVLKWFALAFLVFGVCMFVSKKMKGGDPRIQHQLHPTIQHQQHPTMQHQLRYRTEHGVRYYNNATAAATTAAATTAAATGGGGGSTSNNNNTKPRVTITEELFATLPQILYRSDISKRSLARLATAVTPTSAPTTGSTFETTGPNDGSNDGTSLFSQALPVPREEDEEEDCDVAGNGDSIVRLSDEDGIVQENELSTLCPFNDNNDVESNSNPAGIDANATNDHNVQRALNETTSTKTIGADVCSICLEEYADDEVVTVLPRCQHLFHTTCIGEWLVQAKSDFCPLCKECIIVGDD